MKIELLDLLDPTQNVQFEQAFFKAFPHQANSKLSHKIWAWDHSNERLALRLNPENISIYVTRGEDKKIQRALAINTNTQVMQSHHFGFYPPVHDKNCCEIATLFSLEDHSILHLHEFLKSVGILLNQQGFERFFTTCAPPLLHFYQLMGGDLIESTVINTETRHFLQFDLTHIHNMKPFSELAAHHQNLEC